MRRFLPVALLLALGCAASRPPANTPEPASSGSDSTAETTPRPPGPGPTIAEARRAIDRALATAPGWEGLRLFTECRRDGELEAIEIYGNGIAIWHGKRQFALDADRITTILEAVRDSGFAAMPLSFGGKGGTVAPPPMGDDSADFATAVLCRVRFVYDGLDKEVLQLAKGEQSEALRELSEIFFRESFEPARTGVEAESLEHGLDKIAHGELAPETLSVMLHYRPEDTRGFRLRINGPYATTRSVQPGAGLGERRTMRLSATELESLARELALEQPQNLPSNLWAQQYTDLSLQVLDHAVSIQARQFAGLESTTHGEAQTRFEAIFQRLVELEARIAGASPDASKE